MLLESILKFYLKPKYYDIGSSEPLPNRASNEAACICIDLVKYMTIQDRKRIADFFMGWNEMENNERIINKVCR